MTSSFVLDGFGLFFDYAGTNSGLFNFEATANVEYTFGTRDGILSIDPTIHDWLFFPLIHPFCPLAPQSMGMQCGQNFQYTLQHRIPDAFFDTTTRLQRQRSPLAVLGIPWLTTCTTDADPTRVARTAAMGVAADGATTLGLSQADADQTAATVDKASNWVCLDNNGNVVPNGGIAHFIIRATRVQVYPDAVQAVWFDEHDPYATGFAYYAMLVQLHQNLPNPDAKKLIAQAMGTLCNRQRRFFGVGVPTYGTMPIASSARGPASCVHAPCPR